MVVVHDGDGCEEVVLWWDVMMWRNGVDGGCGGRVKMVTRWCAAVGDEGESKDIRKQYPRNKVQQIGGARGRVYAIDGGNIATQKTNRTLVVVHDGDGCEEVVLWWDVMMWRNGVDGGCGGRVKMVTRWCVAVGDEGGDGVRIV
ncbi:hypothetical protein Tco_0965122 [Tanacetum coccineum]